MRKTIRVALLALVLACFAGLIPGTARADTTASGAGTCTPGTIIFHGPYRVYDNAWLGRSSKRFCVTSTGLNITIASNAAPVASGKVVAYPSIRYGRFFGDLDKPSGFPLPLPGLGRRGVVLHVASTGHAGGVWQSDVDAWIIPGRNWTGHGTAELVIVNRSSSHAAARGQLVRVAGVRYRVESWITCQHATAGGCDPSVRPWRLIYMVRVNQATRDTIHLGRVIRKLMGLRLLHHGQWLGDVAYGTELWHGGKGLTDSMAVTS